MTVISTYPVVLFTNLLCTRSTALGKGFENVSAQVSGLNPGLGFCLGSGVSGLSRKAPFCSFFVGIMVGYSTKLFLYITMS